MGQGVNGVTGDYSRGAAGFWVENGQLAYPVHEVTIAGNLQGHLPPHRRCRFRHRCARRHPRRVGAGRGDDDRGRVKPRGLLPLIASRRRIGHGRFGRTYQVAQGLFRHARAHGRVRRGRRCLRGRRDAVRLGHPRVGRFMADRIQHLRQRDAGQVAARRDGIVFGRHHQSVILQQAQHFVQHRSPALRAGRPGRRRTSVARHR